MAYKKNEIESIFESICNRIIDGESLRTILNDKGMPTFVTFYKWLDDDENKIKQYARAKEIYADTEFEKINEIANHTNEDHTPFTGANVVQRDRLRIDAIKWRLSKMNPKKYGDKVDLTTDGQKLTFNVNVKE